MKRKMLSLITGLGILFLSVTANAQGWIQDSGGWKYETAGQTIAQNRWLNITDADGKLKWYYFDENAYMAHDQWIGEYYVGSDGAMLTETVTPDGYFVDYRGKWIPWLKDGSYVAYKGMDKYVYTIVGACSDSISVNGIPLRRTKSDSAFYTTSGNGYTYTVVPFSDQMFIFGITKLSNFGMTFYEFHLQQ